MTAREFLKVTRDLPLGHRFTWGVPNSTGFLFYKAGQAQRYFIPKEEAKTKFDLLRFVAIHNIEEYSMVNYTEQFTR